MEDQNNHLVLKPSMTQHRIQVEDEERKFEHDNTYKSCCLLMDKRGLIFFTQLFFSASILIFCIVQLCLKPDCETYAKYSSMMMLIVGVYLPNPHLKD
jgi:hypothetical protein